MTNLSIYKKSGQDQVYERLCDLITSSTHSTQHRLAPVRDLAREFGTSTHTIQVAIERLAENGYVVRKPRQGVYVTPHHRPVAMKDMVALCMGARRDHVWGELASMLCGSISDKGHVPVIIERDENDGHRLLERVSHTDAPYFIVNGRAGGIDQKMMSKPPFDKKTIIGVVEWCCPVERQGLYRVLTDNHDGARQVVEHLVSLGHKKVLIVGQELDIHFMLHPRNGQFNLGREFVSQFEAAGGRWDAIVSDYPGQPRLDEDRFVSYFRQADPPTAIFALQDVQAWVAQGVISQRLPELMDKVAIVGYYDTPWSQAARPGITTVNLNIEEITARVMETLEAVRHGKKPAAELYRVRPRLVVRDTSISAG